MPIGVQESYTHIVERGRGGYCFVLSCLFASLLRNLGYGVSELVARVYPIKVKSPEEVGWDWSATTHMTLVAKTQSEGRYLVDVGFGGVNCPRPIPLIDGSRVQSLSPSEIFELRNEILPGTDPQNFPDQHLGWTVYRHLTLHSGEKRTTPCYHFVLQSVAPADLNALSFFSAHSQSANATFVKLLLTSRLNKDGSRNTLELRLGEESPTLYTRDLNGKVVNRETVPSTNAKIMEVCRGHFGFPEHTALHDP